jgi:mannose PTS system EIIA component
LIGIVIVAHGGLAREYRLALEHVVGRLDQIATIATGPDDDRAAKQAEICAATDGVDTGDGVVIVADLWGGSPCNLSLMACGPDNRRILSGANLPLLIKLARSRHLSVDEAVTRAAEAGRKYIASLRPAVVEPMRNWGT